MLDFNRLNKKMNEDNQKSDEQRAQERAEEWARISAEYAARDALLADHLDRLSKDSRLGKWERDFVRDMRSAVKYKRDFTDAQMDKINELNARYAPTDVMSGGLAMKQEAVDILRKSTGRQVTVAEQDVVEQYAAEIDELLHIVGHSLESCMITDESSIYDFCTCYPEDEEPLDDAMPENVQALPRKEQWLWHVDQWHEWLHKKLAESYAGISLDKTPKDDYLINMAKNLRDMRDEYAYRLAAGKVGTLKH